MFVIRCVLILFLGCSALAQYDYADVLGKSFLFYEAQRSGKLPADQKVTWRKDSALDDKGANGEDLTGGYYDAGDFVKFGFPMAFSTTLLSWGIVDFEDAYESAGVIEDARAAVKWATDYFIKCHVDTNVFYGQVGDGNLDHAWWGRPEDMTMERPAFQINASAPGSDLAGETAAAFAAASMVFKEADPEYSATLLQHAKELFEFANTYRDLYSNSIANAASFYVSTHYEDELVWAAVWLYKATEDEQYLTQAEDLYEEFDLAEANYGGLTWDEKMSGMEALLAGYSDKPIYSTKLKGYLDYATGTVDRTPKGLIFIGEWGCLRAAASVAVLLLQAAELGIGNADSYRALAKSQIDYALGDAGRSYVVGFGENPPTHESHRSASCPDAPDPCDWDTFNGPQENYHVLTGALVGGPDIEDNFVDNRSDYVHNEVACDYNAIFTYVVAGIIHLDLAEE